MDVWIVDRCSLTSEPEPDVPPITQEAKKDRCVFHKELKVRYKSGSHTYALTLHALFVLPTTVNTCLQYCLHSGTHEKVKPAAFLASRSYCYSP